ncbi:MAG: DUF3105 domain-containing protein [Chloroflexia bacterium]|nr:DUF3105 domain-containing protein [Chloroflexia bacterium]
MQRPHLVPSPRRALITAAMAALLLASPLAAQDEGSGEPTPAPPEIAGLETFEVDSAAHTEDDVDYPQDPPAGGPHNPVWQSCGFFEAPVRPEHAVHSQEHGAVWITVRPGLPERDVTLLQRLTERNEYILVSPYPEQEEPVVLSAWGAQLRLEEATDERLRAFVRAYAGNGPELGAPCDGGTEETLALPAASPVASPVATPTA